MQKHDTDVVIIGAGPVGLFQVFELGLLGLKAMVIDGLEEVGGQCAYLYPEKPIYDIPALPGATGQSTIANLMAQAAPFEPEYLLNNKVVSLAKHGDLDFIVCTDKGIQVSCKAVVIATGNGAFEPVRLKVPGIHVFEGKQLHYQVKQIEAFRGKDLVILGGGDSAFDWVDTLLPVANSIVQIHRSETFRAHPANVTKMHTRCEQMQMQFLCGQVVDFQQERGRLSQLLVQSKDGVRRRVSLDSLLVFFGMTPKPGPLNQWGLEMAHHQVLVDTEKFQTSTPGIYAVGDVNQYHGKRKLILSGFHEAALAAFAIKSAMQQGKKVATLYTTVNQRLQGVLSGQKSLSA